jgi:hypothetical protein
MATGEWRMENLPPEVRALWEASDQPLPLVYMTPGGLVALVSREDFGGGDMRWHISVRFGDPGINGRVPTWEEMVDAAHSLRPGIVFVIGVPPRSWWMSVHPDVLHLHEVRDPALVEQYRANALGSVPS